MRICIFSILMKKTRQCLNKLQMILMWIITSSSDNWYCCGRSGMQYKRRERGSDTLEQKIIKNQRGFGGCRCSAFFDQFLLWSWSPHSIKMANPIFCKIRLRQPRRGNPSTLLFLAAKLVIASFGQKSQKSGRRSGEAGADLNEAKGEKPTDCTKTRSGCSVCDFQKLWCRLLFVRSLITAYRGCKKDK